MVNIQINGKTDQEIIDTRRFCQTSFSSLVEVYWSSKLFLVSNNRCKTAKNGQSWKLIFEFAKWSRSVECTKEGKVPVCMCEFLYSLAFA